MQPMQYIDDGNNFQANFDRIPIFWKFDDETLRTNLCSFLMQWNNPKHTAWKENHCPEMVDHGLIHSRNLFMIMNRLFHDNDNLIELLNDGEKACLVFAIWLHDIGMSKWFFTPTKDNLDDLNHSLENYNIKPKKEDDHSIDLKKQSGEKESDTDPSDLSLSDITPGWIRNHHALLSRYVILNDYEKINFGIENDESLRRIVGKICFGHSSKVRLTDSDKYKEFYINIPPVDEQRNGFETLVIDNKEYQINLLFLSALIRFIDGCDQTRKRLISEANVRAQQTRNQYTLDNILNDLQINITKEDYDDLARACSISKQRYQQESKELEIIKRIIKDYSENKAKLEELKHICCFRQNMDYKKSVNDIFFKDGRIVLACSDEYYNENDVNVVIEDITHELKMVGDILKNPPNSKLDIGIPYCLDEKYSIDSTQQERYTDEKSYEVPEYETYQKFGGNMYDDIEYFAQKSHEEYISKEREKGNSVITNAQMHLWNRISESSRNSNRRHSEDYFKYLRLINCEIKSTIEYPGNSFSFTEAEVECLAKEEHKRWMKQKFEEGWSYSMVRDDKKKLHNWLIDWDKFPEVERQKDRNIILKIPEMFEKINMTIVRKE